MLQSCSHLSFQWSSQGSDGSYWLHVYGRKKTLVVSFPKDSSCVFLCALPPPSLFKWLVCTLFLDCLQPTQNSNDKANLDLFQNVYGLIRLQWKLSRVPWPTRHDWLIENLHFDKCDYGIDTLCVCNYGFQTFAYPGPLFIQYMSHRPAIDVI